MPATFVLGEKRNEQTGVQRVGILTNEMMELCAMNSKFALNIIPRTSRRDCTSSGLLCTKQGWIQVQAFFHHLARHSRTAVYLDVMELVSDR